VLCYFYKQDPVVKQKLLWSYCADFYGSVLWDINHPSMEDVCIAWRKGLKRIWQLPLQTHSGIVAPICGLLPLRLEIMCQCAGFIVKCLESFNGVVRSVATHVVFVQRMRCPVGRNAQHCASVFEVPLVDMTAIIKKCLVLVAETGWII